MDFFTADQHFGHENIIGYQNRPFDNVEQMDCCMIDRWNAVVTDKDTVYHLGDFCLGNLSRARTYFRLLNGDIRILRYPGHHDKRWLSQIRNEVLKSLDDIPVTFLPPITVLEYPSFGLPRRHTDGGRAVKRYPHVLVLCHYPMAKWDRSHYGSWHVHGHSHGGYRPKGKMLDVGVDSQAFRPVPFYGVKAAMESRSAYPPTTIQGMVEKFRSEKEIDNVWLTPHIRDTHLFMTTEVAEIGDWLLRHGYALKEGYVRAHPDDDSSIDEEIGDLLVMTATLASQLGVNMESAVAKTLAKIRKMLRRQEE